MWKPKGYRENSSVQYSAAMNLLDCINISRSRRILDIGCGDGKITIELLKKAPKATVYGIDKSKEMIDYCKEHYSQMFSTNVSFNHISAEEVSYKEKFDLIFSSFSLHFIINIEKFLITSKNLLGPKGLFAAIIPQGIPLRLSRILNELMNTPEWSIYFKSFRKTWNFHSKQKIQKILNINNLKTVELKRKIHKHWFISEEKFKSYLMFSFPHLSYIPEKKVNKFLEEIISKYSNSSYMTADGKIKFFFPILNVVAKVS